MIIQFLNFEAKYPKIQNLQKKICKKILNLQNTNKNLQKK